MLLLKWGALRASAVSWLVAVIVSLAAFGGSWLILAWSQVKALVLAANLLVIVWGALLLYSLASEAGTLRAIGLFIPHLSKDRSIQLLLIAWLLASFLQMPLLRPMVPGISGISRFMMGSPGFLPRSSLYDISATTELQ